eukprot:TRINITY_DN1330_c0_g1_i3.p1 TRINITY_DN1330_c0_g1~~TRINITY_DN1330_c0_g1_i3.p1  ORF type:complete len:228 (+),score=28.20 TRINITY_DN1330_c0_g1_i3:212-895(+)
MPLIESIPGPEREKLVDVLKQQDVLGIGWICLTSPEGAQVFLQQWKKAQKPNVYIACVGKGTAKILEQDEEFDQEIGFIPSKANAAHLGQELPRILTQSFVEQEVVLYPTSVRATKDLQTALTTRGFAVIRLNTYNTVGVTKLSQDILEQAKKADIVAVASPSAVKAWKMFIDEEQMTSQILACIGSTSAETADKLGFKKVVYPQSPGIDGWVNSIKAACEMMTIEA